MNSIDKRLQKKEEELTELMDAMDFETGYDRQKEYAKRLKKYIDHIPRPLWTDEVRKRERFCKLDFDAVKLWDGTEESIESIEDPFLKRRVKKAVEEYKAYHKKRFDRYERIKQAERKYPGKETDIDNMTYYMNATIAGSELSDFEKKRGQEAMKRFAESNGMKITFEEE